MPLRHRTQLLQRYRRCPPCCPSHRDCPQPPPGQGLRPEFRPQTRHSSHSERAARVESQQETNDHHVGPDVMTEVRPSCYVLSYDTGQTLRFRLYQLGLRFQKRGRENGAVHHGSAQLPCHAPLRGDCPSPNIRPHFFDSYSFFHQH